MAVLCEAISVIVRRDSIDKFYQGGWLAFQEDLPHNKMCTDEELVSVGFWDSQSVEEYIDSLENKGLQFESKKEAFGVFDRSREINDIAVIEQDTGLWRPCNWIEQMRSEFGSTGIKVLMCWLFEGHKIACGINIKGTQIRDKAIYLHTPPGWTPEGSPVGHFKLPHLWPVKLPQAGWVNYQSTVPSRARRAVASLSR